MTKMRASLIFAGTGGNTRLSDVLRETGFGGSDADHILRPSITIKARDKGVKGNNLGLSKNHICWKQLDKKNNSEVELAELNHPMISLHVMSHLTYLR